MEYYNAYDGTVAGNGDVSKGTAGIPGRDDDKKLFVGGLSRQTTDKELREHFSKFGEIESVTVKVDPYTGQSRGFAFIVFSDALTIDKLLNAGDHFVNKRKVDPKRVSKKAQPGKIFVGGLTPDITDEDLKEFFSQYGTVLEIQAPFDKQKNQRKGFCFITFESKDVVHKLLKTPKQCIKGKEVDVKKVKVNPEIPGVTTGYPVTTTWGFGGYPGGYGYQEYTGYQDPSYDYTGYDYTGYGYGTPTATPAAAAASPPAATVAAAAAYVAGKPRGTARQFQRHQPY